MTTLLSAFFLALVTERVMAALVAPIKKRWPDIDLWWLLYPTWIIGGVLAYFANINLFTDLVPGFDPTFGRLLTAVVAGGGANLLHDIFDRPAVTTITTSSSAPQSAMSATVRTTTPLA